jgi:L-histidine Nalpha-methyltransferase
LISNRVAPVDRMSIVHLGTVEAGGLARDVRRGLAAPQKWLPPKYFYDDRGSALFEAICDLPEYGLTRAEQAILDRIAGPLLAELRPTDVLELGSGSGRKTRTLLRAGLAAREALRYLPLDVDEAMLRSSAAALLGEFPGLTVLGLVGDFERLGRLPDGDKRLFLFLGSTIGNLDDAPAVALLGSLRRQMRPDDRLLVGFDLVKDERALLAAYDDAAGVTAEFNRNVLAVINRVLDADFVPAEWAHEARWNRAEARIEMHLRTPRAVAATIGKLDLTVAFAAGETIHTENSRKFTQPRAQALFEAAELAVERWELDPTGGFALALAAPRR